METGDTIKHKFKCKDGKIRNMDCVLISVHETKQRSVHPVTFKPIGEWTDCYSCVVRWIDTDGRKKTDNIVISK